MAAVPAGRGPKRFRPPQSFITKDPSKSSGAPTKSIDNGKSSEGAPLDPIRYARNCYVISCTEGADTDIEVSQRFSVWATTKYRTAQVQGIWEAYLSGKTKTPPLFVVTAFVKDGTRPIYGLALLQGPPQECLYAEMKVPSEEARRVNEAKAEDPEASDDEREEASEEVAFGSPWLEPGKYGNPFPVNWLIKCTDELNRPHANYKISKLRDLEQVREVDALVAIKDVKDKFAVGVNFIRDDAGLLIYDRIREIREREEAERAESGKRARRAIDIEYAIPPEDAPGAPDAPAPISPLASLYAQPDISRMAPQKPSREYWDPNETHFSAYIYDQDYYDAPTIGVSPDGEGPLDAYNFFLAPVVRLFGITAEGFSVCAHIRGFTPYFYVRAPDSLSDRLEYDRKALTPDVIDVDHRDPRPGTHIHTIANHWKTLSLCTAFRDNLNRDLLAKMRYFEKNRYGYPAKRYDQETKQWVEEGGKGVEPPCHKVELVRKETLKGWRPHLVWFLKLYMSTTHFVKPARELLESGAFVWLKTSSGEPSQGITAQKYDIYEANIAYVLRYMIDARLSGCSWVTFTKGKYIRWEDPQKNNLSRCDIEVIARWNGPTCHEPDDPSWSHHAPIRYIAFDIECAGRNGRFPIADCDDGDPVICVAIHLFQEHEDPTKSHIGDVLFTWGSCAQIKETNVLCYYTRRIPEAAGEIQKDLNSGDAKHNRCGWSRLHDGTIAYWTPKDELTMFRQMFAFITEVARPQVFTGFNVDDFDLPYLIKRATRLGFPEFDSLGWIKNSRAQIKSKIFESKARGRRELCDIQLPGLVPLDVLKDVMLRHKLRSYTLNAVAANFLKDKDGEATERKADVPHHLIGPLWRDTDESRKLVAYYCYKTLLSPDSSTQYPSPCLVRRLRMGGALSTGPSGEKQWRMCNSRLHPLVSHLATYRCKYTGMLEWTTSVNGNQLCYPAGHPGLRHHWESGHANVSDFVACDYCITQESIHYFTHHPNGWLEHVDIAWYNQGDYEAINLAPRRSVKLD